METKDFRNEKLIVDEIKVIEKIESIIHASIPAVDSILKNPFGMKIEDGHVTGLRLNGFGEKILAIPYEKLPSLEELFLATNNFKTPLKI